MCVCVHVCVCVCVCVCTSIYCEGFMCQDHDVMEQINNVMLKTLNSYANSLHCYLRMQNLT